jgi:hypothetical protein
LYSCLNGGPLESRENRFTPLLALIAGYVLIMVTIWSRRPVQRWLFWIDASFFLCAAIITFRKHPVELPQLDFTLVVTGVSVAVAGAMVLVAAQVGTLHGLFGTPRPLLHAGMYLSWAIVQQWIQQSFFFCPAGAIAPPWSVGQFHRCSHVWSGPLTEPGIGTFNAFWRLAAE